MTRVQGEYFTQGSRDPTHQNGLGWIDSQRLENMVGEVVTGTGTSGLHLAPTIPNTSHAHQCGCGHYAMQQDFSSWIVDHGNPRLDRLDCVARITDWGIEVRIYSYRLSEYRKSGYKSCINQSA